MKVTTSKLQINQVNTEAVVVPIFENEKPLPNQIEKIISEQKFLLENEFSGKLYETLLIPIKPKVLLVGAGKKEDFDNRIAANIAGTAARRLIKSKVKSAAFDTRIYSDLTLIIQGFGVGQFDPGIHKTGKDKPKEVEELVILGELGQAKISDALFYVETTNQIRSMIFEPANKLTPKNVVDYAKKISQEFKISVEVFDEKQALGQGMGAFAGIAQGSHQPSYMIAMRYFYSKSSKTLGVVGKGITFDSGGLSIKPSDKMHEMKMDMAGAASALGFMRLVGKYKPKMNVVCVTPITENLPGGGALKPGDVVKAMNGKTIEVLNTDAEGRVVLSDALVYAQKLGAEKIVDLATLTGAVIVALGNEASAILGNDDEFTSLVIKSGNVSGERMWQLPIYPEHKELLRSDIADMANIPPSRGAGVIAGAVFLQEFIEPKNSWVHLDTAGTAWLDGEKPYLAKGPTGVGLRTLLKLLEVIN